MFKAFKVALLSLAVSIGVILWLMEEKQSETETSTFCAYGKVFVEFTSKGRTWGTIMLDKSGMPVPCEDSSAKEPVVNFKGIT